MENRKAGLKAILKYKFENTLSRGTIALIGWLNVLSITLIIIGGLVITILGLHQENQQVPTFWESVWISLVRTLDGGTFGQDTGWGFRLLTLGVTMGGVFIVSLLIGILSTALRSKIDQLMRGKTLVLEENHTLIIRWEPKIFTIISELILANENKKGLSIVVLADKDKVEMEEEIRAKIKDFKTTKIICRSGKPLDINDLEVVSPHKARSIIIISPEAPNPDTHVIKSVLALTNNPKRKKEKYHIVAEIKDEANIEAANVVGQGEVTYVLSFDVAAKVAAQTCRQSGLSLVYTELLDYEGDEIYFQEEKKLIGRTFKESLFLFKDSSVIGMQLANGTVMINPPMDCLFKDGDKVIAISEDDDTVVISENQDYRINETAIQHEKTINPPTENTLFLGWNEKGPRIIKELDNYAVPGSKVLIVAEMDNMVNVVSKLNKELKKQKVEFSYGNITFRSILNTIDIPSFDHIIILSYTNIDVQESDALTLICLLHLRNISEACGKSFSIVSEMQDVRNQPLAEVARPDDFIISDKMTSLMLAQLSENKYLKDVFDEFFDAEGSEIYLKPVSDYIVPGKEINFYTVLESAARLGEVAFGYRLVRDCHNADKFYGVVVNPEKTDKIIFGKEDKIIVLAEE
ncbi:MAG: TrkA-N domain protein [Ignavibacteria bacterium]|nr:TrkA-N domain protein [Ignavibacteria bacterium]